jgi:hypothetical protein
LAEDYLVIKRALSAVSLTKTFGVAGFLSLCLSLSAQQETRGADSFNALNNSDFPLPLLTLSVAQPFSFSGAFAPSLLFIWMEPPPPLDVSLPPIIVTASRTVATVSAAPREDSPKEVVGVRRNPFDYASGEVGVFYGSSSGKFGREVEAGYIFGETGNDKFQISAGASYERSTRHH